MLRVPVFSFCGVLLPCLPCFLPFCLLPVLSEVAGAGAGLAGRVINHIPSHITLVCPQLWTFEVSRKGSRVGVGEDVMQLRQNVSSIGLQRLLRNCPVCHSKQQNILLEHGEGGEGGQEPPVRIECKRNLADGGGGEPAKGSSKLETPRCDWEDRRLP